MVDFILMGVPLLKRLPLFILNIFIFLAFSGLLSSPIHADENGSSGQTHKQMVLAQATPQASGPTPDRPQQPSEAPPAQVTPQTQEQSSPPVGWFPGRRRPAQMPQRPQTLAPQAEFMTPSGQAPAMPPMVQPPSSSALPAQGGAPAFPAQPQSPQAAPQAQGQPALPAPSLPGRSIGVPAAQRVEVRGGQISLNFDDADVFSVIQTIFGEVLRVNYVVDPRVKGRVNFRSVTPVDKDKVLPLMEVILRLNGIAVVEDKGLYRIVPISDVSREPSPVGFGREAEKISVAGKALLQVIPIYYLQSSEIVRMITPFLSANAVVVDVPKGNQIIVVDTDASVKRILQLIEIFDSEKLKKRTQVYVYHVQNSKAKDVATLLQQIFLGAKTQTQTEKTPARITTPAAPATLSQPQASSSAQPQISLGAGSGEGLVSDVTKIIYDEILNAVIVLSTPEDYALIEETIKKIDIMPRQVVIEGMIAQVSLTDNLSLGLAAFLKGSIRNFDVRVGFNATNLNVDLTQPTGTGFSFYGIDSIGKLQFLIQALATESKAKLLATPHILVSDNREARIQVGQQVPLVTSETYGSTTIAPQRTIQYKDIGIILKVKPRVNEGGLVSLELSQEVSTYSTEKLFTDSTEIILHKTEATTTLVVQDGQTIVIGGLIREDTSRSRSGLPWLIKIPILGWLFGSTDKGLMRTELVILLTPHVIKDLKDAKGITSDYVDQFISKDNQIKKKDLLKNDPGGSEP